MVHIEWRKRGRWGLAVLGLTLMACAESGGPARPEAEPPAFDGTTLYRGLMLGNGEAADFLATRADIPRLSDLVGDPMLLAQVTTFQDRLIATIDSVNPGFFTEFARAMTSGEHQRVQAMYRQAAEVTFRTLFTLEESRRVHAALADSQTVQALVEQRLSALGRNDPEAKAAVRQTLEALYAASAPESGPETSAESRVRPLFATTCPDDGSCGGGGGGATTLVYAVVAAVYYVAAINVAVASNFVVTISIGTYLAIGSNTPLAPTTDLAHEQLVHAVATNLAAAPKASGLDRWL